jgi:hypothetical protein
VLLVEDGLVVNCTDADPWDGFFTEYDRYGRSNGHEYVRCNSCRIEALAGHQSDATHRDDCHHE